MTSEQNSVFISCDWGTSRLRLRMVAVRSLQILCECSSEQGIAQSYTQWERTGDNPGRSLFFSRLLRDELIKLEQNSSYKTEGIPVLCSGMASSSMGIIELPYADLPFALDGSNAVVKSMAASDMLPNPLFLISGLKSDSDVIRGEETELTGINHLYKGLASDYLAILPGTHSKHIAVENEKVIGFKTYMSGELFTLLSVHSTLKHSLEFSSEIFWNAFEDGLLKSTTEPILSNLFQVRVRQVLNNSDKRENRSFLSGLIIGAELYELTKKHHNKLVIAGNNQLSPLYIRALHSLGLDSKLIELTESDNDLAVAAGQLHIYQQYLKRND